MADITITEALAELKTIDKRIEKKRQFVMGYIYRQDMLKDPLEKEGGSVSAVQRERQSISDLFERKIAIRRAIQDKNAQSKITVNGVTNTIADWLVWKRDVCPIQKDFLNSMSKAIEAMRNDVQKRGLGVFPSGTSTEKPTDIIVNVSESELASQIEGVEELLGTLDGQLSLKNATLTISV